MCTKRSGKRSYPVLTHYGNTLILIDATYKSTKYSIPLFFLCVKTNVSYTVVAEFIVQSETSEHILEALFVLKSWNPYMLKVYKYHALPEHHSSFKAPTRLPQASLLKVMYKCTHTDTHTHTQLTYKGYNSTYSLYPLSYIHRRPQHQTIFQHQELLYLRHSFLYPYHHPP